jgi:hypothetical protein
LKTSSAFGALSRFVGRGSLTRKQELCELCAAPIGPSHSHIVDIESRELKCSCRSCYLLFTRAGAAQGKYRAVPDRYLYEASFCLSKSQWDQFQIPVRIAFFFHNSALGKMVAFYPSPAGATESMLSLDAWRSVLGANPQVATMAPDVEALLVRGHKDGTFDCFIVPIDACYELTGLIRRRWKGFDGGEEAWREVDGFFERIRSRVTTPSPREAL